MVFVGGNILHVHVALCMPVQVCCLCHCTVCSSLIPRPERGNWPGNEAMSAGVLVI